MILILIISILQYYICWATYRNWFKHEITYGEMLDSYSFIGMVCMLPFIIWIPILPIALVCLVTGFEYLIFKFKK